MHLPVRVMSTNYGATEYDDYMPKLKLQTSDADVYTDDYAPSFGGKLVSFNISKHFEYSLIKSEEELGNINGVKIEDL